MPSAVLKVTMKAILKLKIKILKIFVGISLIDTYSQNKI